MRIKMKRFLGVLLSLVLILGLVPGMSLTAYADGDVSYQEASWNETKHSVEYTTKTAINPITLTESTTAWGDGNWYVVPAASVTISSRITVTGTANLILTDGSTLTAPKGITVEDSNSLNIYAQSEGTGSLSIADADSRYAAIGGVIDSGSSRKNSGSINIYGGNLTVTGGGNSAAIGAGNKATYTSITIYGGTINATSGNNAGAAIGAGNSNKIEGGTITIYGGTVNATGIGAAAGIGGGTDSGAAGTVTIYGGTVTATAGNGVNGYIPAGIGAAGYRTKNESVTINGGTIIAIGGSAAAAGIGKNNRNNSVVGSITIGENVKMSYSSNGTEYTDYESDDYSVRYQYMKAEPLVAHTHDGVSFQPWTSTDSLPTESGSYYLTQNVTLSETWTVPGTNNLCLNGHSINGPTNASSVFNVNTNTTLNLYDCGVTAGAIIARYNNGVAVAPGSTFNLYGGKITSNTDNQAIGVENFGTFNMYGGEISGNKGTGVSNVDGTFTMTGGTIRDNGKGVANQDIFKLSGNPTITNNKSGTGDSAKDNNVSLANNKVITIDGVLSNTTPIGVTMSMSAPGVFTSGWNDKMSDKTPTDYFTSDDSAYTVQVDGNELKLAVIKTNPTVTAPTAKSLTYTGSAQELVNAGSTNDGTLYYAVTTENTAPTDENLYTTSIPTATNAGTYYVWYKVVGDVNHNDTSADCVTVTISKAEVSAPTIASKTYNTQNQTATVAASDLYTVTTNEGGTNVGDYDVVLTLTDSDNYKWTDSEDAAKTLTFQITQATASAVETPTPDAVTYDPAKTLESVTLPDGWAWADSTIVPTVNNDGYSAAYTVTDDTNYDYSGIDGYSAETHKVTRTVVLTVNKADPTADAPTGLTATYGQTLADVTLTNPDGNTAGTWAWVDDTTSVGNAGSNTFKANFTPTDTTNYNGKTNVDVTVTVGKADPTATAPTATATYGDTLADVTLTNPAGNTAGTWSWVDAGTTSVGNAGSNTFKANFTPTDTANYNSKTNVNVTVTVGKADPSAEVNPVTGLVYDGETKKLVTAEVEGGTLQYRISEDGEWTDSIPEAVDFDTYTIYYYIKGDENHKDAGSELDPLGSVEVTIKCPYSNEWVKGKWYNKDGSQTYKSLGSWQKDGTDWMYVDESGWTAKNRWQKIDFKWYFFDREGHMTRDAYQKDASGKIWYLTKNGSWDEKEAVAGWTQDDKGWKFVLYGDDYLKNTWKKINGNWYYFKADGYAAQYEFVKGYWLSKTGAWKDSVHYSWHKSGSKWWYGIEDGWYAKNGSYIIDGKEYTFDKKGYCVNP